MKKILLRSIARTLLLTLTYQLVFPACAFALTTGPSQPEVQSFEPVGTTEMVDLFSGDFNYNIPLMDVEGYPINIFYHSGVGIEQEASWVGLGWNINPGEINRTVRGLPDDFNGETLEKYTKVKDEKDIRVGIGANVMLEIFGKNLKLGVGDGIYVNHNNYRGVSAGIAVNVGIKTPAVSFGVNVGIGSQTGADIDLNATANLSTKHFEDGARGSSIGGSLGGGFNSRTGLKDFSFDVSVKKQFQNRNLNTYGVGLGTGTTIPVGIQNYVPVITNQIVQNAYAMQLKAGGIFTAAYGGVYVDVMVSNIKYQTDGSRPGYGYLYAENATKEGIMDFSRDKDGMYNSTMQNLPMSTNTYDIYSVNGQGTGGMFRPFRNDIGTIYDPYVSPSDESDNYSALLEAGIGNLFEAGSDLTTVRTRNECGPWSLLTYGGPKPGTLYEKFFFKNGGDISYNQQQEAGSVYNLKPVYVWPNMQNLSTKGGAGAGKLPNAYDNTTIFWDNTNIDRSARATHIAYQTAEQAQVMPELDQYKKIISYENGAAGRFYDPKLVSYNRHNKTTTGGANHNAAPHHVSEFTQTLKDGRRYVYGIPAINNVTREVTFAIDEARANWKNGCVGFNRGVDDGPGNTKGTDNLYSTNNTPAYAHSYLMTGVLSADYVDVLGDGPSDDDLGSFTKINYTLTDKDYRWRTPYSKDSAQLDPGFRCDTKDGKGNFISGSRQQWYVRSIESKNYIAEFYTSKRKDGLGIKEAVLQSGSKINGSSIDFTTTKSDSSFSYKLDSVVLYNKHDRYINKENAVAVKTVIFQYDYSLCPNTPNSVDPSKGKLTLRKIFVKYGSSQKNLLSPYVFDYNASNPTYDFAAKDRWGNYKEVVSGTNNYDFPYCLQPQDADVTSQNLKLAAWNLTDIKLPSGGKLHVDYESDDYSFVQDKRAMQMLKIEGVGSGTSFEQKDFLYSDENNINDYVYFKRRKDKERPGVSMKDNYLEGQDLVYYSFDLDVTGRGNFEYIRGFAKFESIGYCNNDPSSDYGYIKLKRENVKGMNLHPAVVLGVNTARYYLPHMFYEGYQENSDIKRVIEGLFGSGEELINTLILQNPFKRFLNKSKSKSLKIANSFIRLQTPNLSKRGGGIRVKQLTLSDNWNSLSGGQAASYGKKYDYTMPDPSGRYGVISSGVASYEPIVGGDENPLRKPVPYSADKGRLLPSVDFYQLEPFGESFYPGATVGYSSVKVTSIHKDYGRSAQAMDEYLFYTAKDFPVKVDFTAIDGNRDGITRDLTHYYKETELMQGYTLILNDMHGKAKAVNNYVLQKDGSDETYKRITGVEYKYRTDAGETSLDNNVDVLLRKRGTVNTYELKKAKLGEDVDLSIDSRQRKTEVKMTNTELNLNVFAIGIFPMFTFSVFHAPKQKTIGFKSLVTTKIVQQYGMVKTIDQFDHDARTTTENLVYDGETGDVLLSRTSNQYNDNIYSRRDPAYWAYEGMMPAYTNTDYEETVDSFVINDYRQGFLYPANLSRFTEGDELLVQWKSDVFKLWVTGIDKDTAKMKADPDSGYIYFEKWRGLQPGSVPAAHCPTFSASVNVVVNKLTPTTPPAISLFGSITVDHFYELGGTYDLLKFKVPVGTYSFTGTGTSPANTYSGTVSVLKDKALLVQFGNVGTSGCDPSNIGSHFDVEASVPTYEKSSSKLQCGLSVAPRYMDRIVGGVNQSNWPLADHKKVMKNVKVKIIRSGRRNNTDKFIQELQFASPASSAPIFTDLSSYMNKTTSMVSGTVTTYTDVAGNYSPFTNSVSIPAVADYNVLNKYVLGLKGNFRPLASYAPIAKRNYDKMHGRYDGTYNLDQQFWSFQNGYVPFEPGCTPAKNIFVPNSMPGALFWKKAATITQYDPNGNALEEQDALGNYSAAQYGYNGLLPVAVASNARAQHIMFDGFEEYHLLQPQVRTALYKGDDKHSTFANLFEPVLSSISGAYPSEQPSGDASVFTRHGQRYQLTNKVSSFGTITDEASHTGLYSVKLSAAKTMNFVEDTVLLNLIKPYKLLKDKRSLVSFWVKSTNPAVAVPFSSITTTSNAITTAATKKSNSIDGWFLMEAEVMPISFFGTPVVTLSLPANIYIDDIRIIPFTSNMKSFVYDPVSLKLIAQLDENHFATFYEYDQEGLLIRTKKETNKGIITISESRRANAK